MWRWSKSAGRETQSMHSSKSSMQENSSSGSMTCAARQMKELRRQCRNAAEGRTRLASQLLESQAQVRELESEVRCTLLDACLAGATLWQLWGFVWECCCSSALWSLHASQHEMPTEARASALPHFIAKCVGCCFDQYQTNNQCNDVFCVAGWQEATVKLLKTAIKAAKHDMWLDYR